MKWGQRRTHQRSGGLRFAGRTPSLQVPGMGGRLSRPPLSAEAGAARQRQIAWSSVVGCMVLSLLIALGRNWIGALPAPQSVTLKPITDFAPQAHLISLPATWWQTVGALPALLFAAARDGGVRGLGTLWLLTMLLAGAWHLAARIQGWQRLKLGVVALVALQGWGAAFYLGQLLPPARVLRSNARPWAFGLRTMRSGALLSPASQVSRMQARGIRGVCFGDETPLASADRAALQKVYPSVLLVNGAAWTPRSKVGLSNVRILGVGARRGLEGSNESEVLRLAKGQGALAFSATGSTNSRAITTPDDVTSGLLADQPTFAPLNMAVADATQFGELRSWTLLPPQARDVGQTFAALKKGRVALAFAQTQRGAWGAAWNDLSTAQKLNVVLWMLALLSLAWLWGSRPALDARAPFGPTHAWNFLRRRRLPPRLLGFLLMSAAFLGSLWACAAALHLPLARLALGPLQVLIVWLLCDVVFGGAQVLWRRKT